MNLIIDIGNTRTKIALFDEIELVDKAFWVDWTLEHLTSYLKDQNITAAILSVTGKEKPELEDYLKSRYKFIRLTHETKVPIVNGYKTPETLGKDRLAAVTGIYSMKAESRQKRNHLVVDAGTCVTYDYIDSDGHYYGGNISPGLEMRLKAMHHFTNKLPLVDRNENEMGLLGDSTESALRNGAIVGLIAEIQGFAALMRKHLDDMDIVITGGDGAFLFSKLDMKRMFYEPDLVLFGLNYILLNNK